jgi:hypothetical protein
MKTRLLLTAITFFMFGCSGYEREYNFKMDYPVDAARLSLGGDIHVNIDCEKGKLTLFLIAAMVFLAAMLISD